jgi:hypothetical protein
VTEKQIIQAMSGGAILCMERSPRGNVYWIQPSRIIVRSDTAEKIIALPGVVGGGDSLFKDALCQTWRLA